MFYLCVEDSDNELLSSQTSKQFAIVLRTPTCSCAKMATGGISSFKIVCGLILLQVRYIQCSDYCVNSTHFNLTFTSETRIDITWFSSCKRGVHFNLSNNEITTVDNDTFNIFWNVRILDLSNNNISDMEPEAFISMRNLQYLYLDHNELDELPVDFFYNKYNLITVDLSFNKITRIPLSVFNYSMSSIREVLLHHNRLTAFEPWAFFRHPVPLVDVRYNNISTFTNDFNWTYIARSVYDEASTDMRYNSISKWQDWYLLQYKHPSARDDGVETALEELQIDLRENPFICDCNAYNLIRRVRQSCLRWGKSKYLSLTCYNPPNLRGKKAFYDVALTELPC